MDKIADNPTENMVEKKWYVVHTYSGYEQKVKESLEDRVKRSGMDESFGDVIVPSEVIMERVKGQAKKSQRTTSAQTRSPRSIAN